MSRIQSIEGSKLIESAVLGKQGRELSWANDDIAVYPFSDPKLRQRVGELISQARRNIPFGCQARELLAALSVVAVLIAGALTKVGYAWWGIALISVLCILGFVIERRVSAQWIGRAVYKARRALKSTQSTTKQGSFSAREPYQA